jgi:hypothetical protein
MLRGCQRGSAGVARLAAPGSDACLVKRGGDPCGLCSGWFSRTTASRRTPLQLHPRTRSSTRQSCGCSRRGVIHFGHQRSGYVAEQALERVDPCDVSRRWDNSDDSPAETIGRGVGTVVAHDNGRAALVRLTPESRFKVDQADLFGTVARRTGCNVLGRGLHVQQLPRAREFGLPHDP